jgi:hypothetical protein
VGVTLDVEPALSVNDEVVDLALTPKVVEFLGFVETAPGQPAAKTATKRTKGAAERKFLVQRLTNPEASAETFERPKPIFHTRTSTVAITVKPGQTVVLLLPSKGETVPFPNPSANRVLLALVTASPVPPEGPIAAK